jgi:hypothetical protein
MNNQKTSYDDARGANPRARTAGATHPSDEGAAEAAGVQGDTHAMTQAARAVMHPDHQDLEWRFYHGATHG